MFLIVFGDSWKRSQVRGCVVPANMAKWKILSVLSLLLLIIQCSKAVKIYGDPNYPFMRNATEAPPLSRNYDYIIIGGGTAGCPLAATLSHNFSVLLLERGGSPYLNELVENLVGFYPNLLINTPTSASQSFTSEDGVPNQRARVLGGGSAINAGFFTYAHPDYVADAGWDGALVNESYAWVADTVSQLPILQVFQTAARDSLLEAGVTPDNGATYEHLIGTKTGSSLFDETGHRHTAADLLTHANPDNLDLYIWATVQHLLFHPSTVPGGIPGGVEGGVEGGVPVPTVVGVLYRDLDGNDHTAFLNDGSAGSEVVVAAGALGTPQLLMLSGIGPAAELEMWNITVVVDNPAVGARMADNPTNSVWVMTNQEVEVTSIQVVGITPFGSYIEVSSGIAEAVVAYMGGNVPNNKLGNRTLSAQVMQQRITNAILSVPPEFRAQAAWSGTILQKIWGPLSWGTLRLNSLSPDDNPRVRFNYFGNPNDLAICEQGVRTVLNVTSAASLVSLQYTDESIPEVLRPVRDAVQSTWPIRDFGNYTQDSINIRQWCMDSVTTIWHYHGGCLVGDVVERDYRVIGVRSLRVIDGSTFRRSPGTNPQATVMMLGRYMGVQILQERLDSAVGV